MMEASQAAQQEQVRQVLVVANETVGGRRLLEAVERRAKEGSIRCVVICPQNRPPSGYVIYDESVRSAAQIRLELTLERLKELGIEAIGEVMDPDPYLAVQDALRLYGADEIIISTYPYPRSGGLRKDLVQRIADYSGLPVEHVVIDLRDEPVRHALVVANETVGGKALIDTLERRASASPHRFTVICPIGGPDHEAHEAAKQRLEHTLQVLRRTGLDVVGQIMDRDALTSIQNAIYYHPADEIIISTFPSYKSRWLRGDLINRARRATGLPVEHVVGETIEPVSLGAKVA